MIELIKISALDALATIASGYEFVVNNTTEGKTYKTTFNNIMTATVTALAVGTTGTATNKFMTQKAVTDAIAASVVSEETVQSYITNFLTDGTGIALNYYPGEPNLLSISVDMSDFTTTNLAEGSNLYYTDARADARITLQKGAVNGIAPLGSDGKIPSSYYGAIAIVDTYVVASEAAMLALGSEPVPAEKGDVAVRTDLNKSFILKGTDPSVLGNWQELLTPTDTVISVNGFTGAVSLTTSDIAEGTNLYYTDTRVRACVLTGFSATNSAIVATDTILQAFNKAQGQINQRITQGGNSFGAAMVIGTADNYLLQFNTNHTEVGSFSATGVFTVGTTTGKRIMFIQGTTNIIRSMDLTSTVNAISIQVGSIDAIGINTSRQVRIGTTYGVSGSGLSVTVAAGQSGDSTGVDFTQTINSSAGTVGTALDINPTFTGTITNIIGLRVRTGKAGFGLTTNLPTAFVDIAASTTAISSLRIRSGTAPTSPNDGDMWYDGTDVKFRVGATTKTFTLT